MSHYNRPFIVCLCGSVRFKEMFEKVSRHETLKGHIVLSPGCFDRLLTDQQKELVDNLHLRKIDMADEIIIINVDKYIGESTANEIRYAQLKGKNISYLEHAGPGK